MAQQLPARSPGRGFSPTDGTKAMPFSPRQVSELGMAIPLGQGPALGGADSKLKGLIKGTMARRTTLPASPPASRTAAQPVRLGGPEEAPPVVLRITGQSPDGVEQAAEVEFLPGTSNIRYERIQ